MSRFQHPVLALLLALILLVSGIAARPGLSMAQEGNWGTPISLSSDRSTGWFPDIAADSTGRVHIVWAGGTTGFDTVLYISSTDGTNWSPINDIAAVPQVGTDSASTRPAIWLDNKGFINLSYVSSTLYFSRALADHAGSAASWSTPLQVSTNQVSYFSRLIQDSQGQLHLFYTKNSPTNACAQCYHLFHSVSTNLGTNWSDPQDISADGTGAAKPQVITDNKNDLFVVWESGVGGGLGQLTDPTVVKFTASYDGGKTWSQAITLSSRNVKAAKNITIGLDIHGNLVTAWLDLTDNTIKTMFSNDGGKSWSTPIALDGIQGGWDVYPTKLDDYSMATDSSGMLHMLAVGHLREKQEPTATGPASTKTSPPSTLNLLHFTWDGNSWSTEVITRISGDVPEWPRLIVSNGNILNAVWFVRDQENIWNSDNAHYKIWYTREVTNAPAIPPAIEPISTITPTASAQSGLTPVQISPTGERSSLPTLSPDEKVPSKAVYSENDFIGIIATSLVPSGVIVLFFGLFFFFRHRR
jgi:hypothetical protein